MNLSSNIRRSLPLAVYLALACGACEMVDVDEGRPAPNRESAKSEILVNNQPLTKSQIAELETTYGVQAVPGDYWYDSLSGLFGTMGEPSNGLLYPGHDFGALPANASRGTSGTFLNGRQLTVDEVQYLAYFTGAIAPGQYWMDGMGNVGYAGNPAPALNLYYLMAQQAQTGGGMPSGGGDNGWSSMYASGNYTDDGSSGYVHIPSSTGGSGTFVSY